MQITIESTSTLERRLKIVVPADEIESAVEDRLKSTASKVRLDGFRPGKVPMREVKRRFGAGIRQEVSGEILQSSYTEAVQQESLNPAGIPVIEDIQNESGQDLEFTAVFEVYPAIALASFDEIEVEKLVATVTDEDIDNMTEVLRKQQTGWKDVKRKSRLDDKVNIDFEGLLDGEAFDGGTAEGVDIVLGSESMIPGFEDGLKGCKKGESLTLDLAFPEEYHAENLAGKDVQFVVKVNSVQQPQLPELDEEFFRRYGLEDADLEKFRAEVRQNMEQELANAVKSKLRAQVMAGLVATNTVELPTSLIDMEIDKMREEAVRQFSGQNAQQLDASLLPKEMFTRQAEERVKLGLIVGEVMKREPMEADPDRVREMIEKMAASYEDSEQVVGFYYSNPDQLQQVRNVVLEEQVVEKILEQTVITEVPTSYEEAIKPPEPPAPEEGDEIADSGDETSGDDGDTEDSGEAATEK